MHDSDSHVRDYPPSRRCRSTASPDLILERNKRTVGGKVTQNEDQENILMDEW